MNSPPLDDVDLLDACRRGRESAWRELVRRHEGRLILIGLRLRLSREEAEDATQEAFQSLVEHLGSIRSAAALRGWLDVTVRRHGLQVLRRRPTSITLDTEPRDPASEPERFELERRQAVHDGLRHLDPDCRRLVELVYGPARAASYRVVASELGMAEGSVGPKVGRCLQRLREIMNRESSS